MTVRDLDQPRGWAFGLAVAVMKPTLLAVSKRVWIDGEKIPASGGCVVVLNHVSHIDPMMAGHFLYDHGRMARYLAKAGLFSNKFLRTFLNSAGQIPVARQTADAVGAYTAAVQAVREGQCVVVYPEGTITRDPGLWPMTGKSGAARIALETGCPVIPVAHWGVQDVLAPYGHRVHVIPRRTVTVKAGDPVDLDDLLELPEKERLSVQSVQTATDRVMAAITGLLEDIRGETAPAERFDPRKAGVSMTGNPHKQQKKGKDN
ncbi:MULTISPECIES: lysophospholipid acyltransferase family protein [unclassified Nocardioides]|uniref:lysophospholipid acyltransferase family protein n=1 Tax=unclassified Nocardioides TaxID=2615069 RepID=UPI0007039BDD|nr:MULTISPECIES: lysophospholipid acyltransferase family protein [unclassified Nocardioides]KQZ69711.1 glycerol acyltransferase [Nocardioides sp. Root151]KRF15803.1 glycerol acyltransferase [Nocardioides sp. Soil796]